MLAYTQNENIAQSDGTSKSTSYHYIDICKLVCSILVIMIHIPPFGRGSNNPTIVFINNLFTNCIARIAVPYFFICSGFLLYKKTLFSNFGLSQTKKYVFRLLRLYITWSIIYFPIKMQSILQTKVGVKAFVVYLWEFIIGESYAHLWYLPATIVAVLIISFLLHKRVKPVNILAISILLYGIGLLGQSYYGLIRPIQSTFPFVWSSLKLYQNFFGTTRNGLFDGFLFVSIGMMCAFYEVNISKTVLRLFFFLSLILLICESVLLNKINYIRASDMFLMLPFPSVALFLLSKYRQEVDKPLFRNIRTLSSLVFYLHMMIYKLITTDEIFGSFAFVGTAILTCIISIIIIWMSSFEKMKWLRRLYS